MGQPGMSPYYAPATAYGSLSAASMASMASMAAQQSAAMSATLGAPGQVSFSHLDLYFYLKLFLFLFYSAILIAALYSHSIHNAFETVTPPPLNSSP